MTVKKVKIYSLYDRPSVAGLFFDSDEALSLTQQHFKDEADINFIMKRYEKTGTLVDPLVVPSRMPKFGDFSDVASFHQAQTLLSESYALFDELPASIRKRFSNDPAEFLAFMNDANNYEEALKLGLVVENAVDDVSGGDSNESSDVDILVDQETKKPS